MKRKEEIAFIEECFHKIDEKEFINACKNNDKENCSVIGELAWFALNKTSSSLLFDTLRIVKKKQLDIIYNNLLPLKNE